MSDPDPATGEGREAIHLVVLIDAYLPILGGAQNNLQELGRRLVNRGYRVTVLTRKIQPDAPSAELIDGVWVQRLGHFPVRTLSKLAYFLSVLRYLLIRRGHYHLVLAVPIYYWPDLLPAFLASLATGRPFLMRTTMAGNFDFMLSGRATSTTAALRRLIFPPALWRRVLGRAAAIINQSDLIHQQALAHGLARCHRIYNGVDTDRFDVAAPRQQAELRRRLGLPHDKVIVICTGRYVVEKNQITLVKAVEQMEHGGARGQLLLLILGANEYRQSASSEAFLKAYVAEHSLQDVVRFYDEIIAVEDYLRASDIFVSPTRFDEGMSNAVLEAMACGLPLICSDLPQLRGMLPPGYGHFFSPLDVQALVGHLQALAQSPQTRQKEGRAIAHYTRKHYPMTRAVDQYAFLFHSILNPVP